MMASRSLFYSSLVVLGILGLPLSYYINTLMSLHNSLSRQITHKSTIGTAEVLSDYTTGVFSLPVDLSQSIILADEAVKIVQAPFLPSRDDEWLLTAYLRYNMVNFASMPQAWILWLLADHDRKATFDQTWISSRKFEPGDRVCGDYVVMYRQANQVEFKMSMGRPGSSKYIEGRLIISINIDDDNDEAIFRTRTLMWRRRDSTTRMPLERAIPKWLHDIASWGLIEQGVQHLHQLGDQKNQ